MYRISLFSSLTFLLVMAFALTCTLDAAAQNSLSGAQPRRSVSVLDSTKDQDGLLGSVRRVKTESARVETKEGQVVQGPLQIIELTTYALKGNRIENVSYPSSDQQLGKQEYKYDNRGNITEMTLRDDSGAILSRESYNYEFDSVGNWTKMVTSLVLFENGRLKREPIENTYRTITYYFDDNVAKIVDTPQPALVQTILPTPPAARAPIQSSDTAFSFSLPDQRLTSALTSLGDAPAVLAVRKKESTPEVVKPESDSTAEPASNSARESSQPIPVGEGSKFAARKEAETPGTSQSTSAKVVTESAPLKTVVSANDAAFKLYEKGLAALDNNDPKGAANAFLESVKLQPSGLVYLNLGIAYLKIEKNGEAVRALKESVSLNPNVADAQYAFGVASFRLKRYPDARDAFKRATQIDPRMAKAHYGLGLTYLELGQPDASTVEMRILESLDKQLAKQLAGTFPRTTNPCRVSMLCQ